MAKLFPPPWLPSELPEAQPGKRHADCQAWQAETPASLFREVLISKRTADRVITLYLFGD